MVKTHPKSRFTIQSLEQIRDASAVVLQIEKTDSTFTETKKAVYLCEVVDSSWYNREQSTERLTDEILRLNLENYRLQKKIERLNLENYRLQKKIERLERKITNESK